MVLRGCAAASFLVGVLGLVLFDCADGGVALGELEAKLTRIYVREIEI